MQRFTSILILCACGLLAGGIYSVTLYLDQSGVSAVILNITCSDNPNNECHASRDKYYSCYGCSLMIEYQFNGLNRMERFDERFVFRPSVGDIGIFRVDGKGKLIYVNSPIIAIIMCFIFGATMMIIAFITEFESARLFILCAVRTRQTTINNQSESTPLLAASGA